jgi:hypothetical protein
VFGSSVVVIEGSDLDGVVRHGFWFGSFDGWFVCEFIERSLQLCSAAQSWPCPGRNYGMEFLLDLLDNRFRIASLYVDENLSVDR